MAWESWRPAVCMPDDCFCEALRPGLIRQPANTFSNLGFVLVGLAILIWGWRRARGGEDAPLGSSRMLTTAYGLIVVFLGVGSACLHATMTYAGQWIDVLSMFLFPSFLALYNATRLGWLTRRLFWPVFAAVNGLLGILVPLGPAARFEAFPALLAALALSEAAARRRLERPRPGWFAAAVGLMGTAFGIWILDYRRILCSPESWLQGHALWHLLCAGATACLFLYYRAETVPDPVVAQGLTAGQG
jgi:hypothetical protein